MKLLIHSQTSIVLKLVIDQWFHPTLYWVFNDLWSMLVLKLFHVDERGPWKVFSCDQAALRTLLSVRLSGCLAVRPFVTPFSLCSHHRIIMKFSGVITNDKSDVHAKGQGQRSKVKVTEVKTQLSRITNDKSDVHAKVQGQRSKVKVTEVKAQLSRFRTVTPVWIHIWWWSDAQSLMLLRRGALLFLKVIRQISRSHGSNSHRFWPKLGVSGL